MKTFFILLFSYALFAGTYDDSYNAEKTDDSVKTELDSFMYGSFKEIVRFDMLSFDSGQLSRDDNEKYDKMTQTIKEYVENNKTIRIKIIGHTSEPTDDFNEKSVASNTYVAKIQNLFNYSLDTNRSKELSMDYALKVQDAFSKDSIDSNLTVVENRGGNDMAFSDITESSRDLSNRVMVTMYVLCPPN